MKSANAEPAPYEKPKVPREIWVMVTAAFIIALGYGLIAPLLPQFVVSFDVSMAAAGLVADEHVADRGMIEERIINRQHCAARIAENVLYTLGFETLHYDLCA